MTSPAQIRTHAPFRRALCTLILPSRRLDADVSKAGIEPAHKGEKAMNWDQVAGNWKQFKGQVKQQWGKLTDDDLQQVDGKREELVGRIQERYGLEKDKAERELDDFFSAKR